MNMQAWLATSGLTVKEEQFLTVPPLPYVKFNDDAQAGYHSLTRKNITHNVTLDLYTGAIDATSEALITALLDDLPDRYTRTRKWADTENCYVTTITFALEEII